MLRLLPAAAAFLASSAFMAAALIREPPPVRVPGLGSPELAAYVTTCGRCHPPFDATTHRKSEWRGVVTAMHQRMGDRAITVAPETLELAIRYLEQHGR